MYWDESSRGYNCSNSGKPKKRGRWVGERNINGKRVRMRSTDFNKVMAWMRLDPSFSPEDITKGKGSTLQLTQNEGKKSRNEGKKSSVTDEKGTPSKKKTPVTGTSVIKKRTFTPLPEFPSYYIDMAEKQVYHKLNRGGIKWKRINVTSKGTLRMMSDGKWRKVDPDKLMAAAESGSSYFNPTTSGNFRQSPDFPTYWLDLNTDTLWRCFDRKGVRYWRNMTAERHSDTIIIKSEKYKTWAHYDRLIKSIKDNVSYFTLTNKLCSIRPEGCEEAEELADFPSYYLNPVTRQIFHEAKMSRYHDYTRWYEVKQHTNKDEKNVHVFLCKEGKVRTVSLSRLLFCHEHKCSYYELGGTSNVFVYHEEKKTEVVSRSDWQRHIFEKRVIKEDKGRIEKVHGYIHTLKLLLKFYQGKPTPLLEYLEGKKQEFIQIIAHRKHWSYDRALMAYEMAYDVLLSNLECKRNNIVNFDGWFIKTAIHRLLHHQNKQRLMRNIDTIPMYSDMKIVRN